MLVSENENKDVTKEEALKLANNLGLDLVLVSDNPNKPVVKLVNWQKFRYEKIKKLKKSLLGSKSSEEKEWWFHANIGQRDMEIKINKIKEFLQKEKGVAKIVVKPIEKKGKRKTTVQEMKELVNKILDLSKDFAALIGEVQQENKFVYARLKLKH